VVGGAGGSVKAVPRVPWVIVGFARWTSSRVGVDEVNWIEELLGLEGSIGVGGCPADVMGGTLRRVTSRRSRGFVPLPGMKTRVEPLLLRELPTTIPSSAEGAYFHLRSVGGIVETGHPKGKRKSVATFGT